MRNFFVFPLFLIANLLSLSYGYSIIEIPQEHRLMIEHHPYRILGVGAACMDLLVSVDEDFLSHIPGEKGGSQAIQIEELNQILSHHHFIPILATGGSCANTIKGLAQLKEKCAFFSHIGTDELGEHFCQYMRKMGIVGLFSKSIHPTPRVLCLITPDSQRTMRFCAGCSIEMSESFLHQGYFKGVKLVHLDAYTLYNGNLTKTTMEFAKEAQALISIDLSSFEVVRQFRSVIMDLLPRYVDIVFANQDEIKALLELSPQEGCFELQKMCPVAVVLMGEEGCLVGHQGKIMHSPTYPAKVIDSTGAGDLFASGFLYGYLKGYPLAECARLGNRLGSAVVEVQGAELPQEKWMEIQSDLPEEVR